MDTSISRRHLIAAGALAAGTVASGTALADEAADTAAQPFEAGIAWDAEYDVIVAGYGAAGAAAAISAAENGAHVLLLEKALKIFAGGNSRFGQNFMAHTELDTVVEYMKAQRGELTYAQGDDVIEFLATGFMNNYDWFVSHGADPDKIDFATRPEYPELWPNSDPAGTGFRKMTLRPDRRFNPQDVNAAIEFFRGIIKDMRDSIDVWYDSPAVRLIQDGATKTVHGVKTTHDGQDYLVRAKNGVVLATGGFENNPEMVQNFTAYHELVAKGCSFNTGDGVTMAQEAGAQLWHMAMGAMGDPNVVNPDTGCTFGWTAASGDVTPPNGWYGTMGMTSSIIVGGDGTRFMNEAANETRNSRHGQTLFAGTWTHMPFPDNTWMVWDEQARSTGHKVYNAWSDGMERELEQGIVVKGETIYDLADQIGIDGAALAQTIERYNYQCAMGVDNDCGRQASCLVPFNGDGPFYACQLKVGVTNTDGGAKRNVRCEVLDPHDEPIPHLYSAGSFGSFWVGAYNGGGNMGENLVTGLEAGKNAAEVKDDSVQDSLLAGEAVNFADTYEVTEFECGENQYIGRYAGMNGDLAVRVTVDGDTIADVEVVEHNETPNVGTMAIDQLPAAIVAAGSTDVATVSGATRTSAAIILAVEAALAEAGIEVAASDSTKETVH